MKDHLKLVTFNCRSVKSSINEVKQLCDSFDIIMIQEHWLLPHELSTLSAVHAEFMAVAKSAVNIERNILIGRPYGGTAILYRKDIANSITAVDSLDPRVCAVKIITNCRPVLFVCVYICLLILVMLNVLKITLLLVLISLLCMKTVMPFIA